MNTPSDSSSWFHVLEPRTWLVVILMSLVLASGSAWVLLYRPTGLVTDLPLQAFDSVERFMRDTIRLTFTSRHKKTGISDDVFVAPRGLLDKDATFKWLDDSLEIDDALANALPPPLAPPRLLDSQWQPAFPGLPD